MTKKIEEYENNSNIKVSESLEELSSIAENVKDIDIDIDHTIAHVAEFGIQLCHIIQTEDEIDGTKNISKEVRDYAVKLSQEFMDIVVAKCAEVVVEFVKKYPQYRIKSIASNNKLVTGKGLAMLELKEMLSRELGG